MTPLARALSFVLLHSVWQGALVAMALWVVLRILRKRSAQARYLAGCAAMALLVVLPAVTLLSFYPHRAAPPRVYFAIPPIHTPVTWIAMLQAWAPPVWAFGVLVFSVRLLWACQRVSLLKRRGQPAGEEVLAVVFRLSQRMRMGRPARVLISALADGPSVAGWIRPVILLPAATLLGLTPEQLEAVLAHELAHIRRHDYLVNLAQMLIETLWFYHPAAWWISSRIRRERELCCDDIAVRCCGDALCYARALAALERMRLDQRPAPDMVLGARDGGLLFRIQRLLGVAPREHSWSRIPAAAAIVLAIACCALNVSQARAQAPAPPAQIVPAPAREQAPAVPPQPANPFGILLPPAPVSADSWIRFSSPDTTPLASRSVSYRFGWEVSYLNLSQGIDLDSTPWLQAASKGVRLDAGPDSARHLESTVKQMTSAREAAQSDEARGIPTWTLTVVNVTGLSDSRREELLSRLPVHESYRVSHERMDAAGQFIRDFDRTLRYSFLTAWDGHAEMQIAAPPSAQ